MFYFYETYFRGDRAVDVLKELKEKINSLNIEENENKKMLLSYQQKRYYELTNRKGVDYYVVRCTIVFKGDPAHEAARVFYIVSNHKGIGYVVGRATENQFKDLGNLARKKIELYEMLQWFDFIQREKKVIHSRAF